MSDIDPNLRLWGWFFLALYIAAMFAFGYVGMRRVKNSDDFATARASYGPLFLAFALTATTASGATFLGIPAIGYKAGFPALWYSCIYPLGVYFGLLICLKGIRRAGAAFGTRSMPEYLGDRFDSEAIRIVVALFSMLLLFYLAGQLLAGAVLFTSMMGIDLLPALLVTAVIIMIYIVIGGAHADILTDGAQGALMLTLSISIIFMFSVGFGMEGGFSGMMESLRSQDPDLVGMFHPTHPIANDWWDVFALFVMHMPLGLLPHIGNKLWALKDDAAQNKFIVISFVFGMILPAITLGGILSRAILGDALLVEGASPNDALPMLFIMVLPTWLAALIGAGVLAAVMSTADGLVVSTSQVFANDIYRLSLAPRLKNKPDDATVDRVSLLISRVATILVVGLSIWLAWESQTMNIALLVAAGVGGMTAAISGPVFAGMLWQGTTKAGALCGFVVGGVVFMVSKLGLLDPTSFGSGALSAAVAWFDAQASNPFACGALGGLASLAAVIVVSLFTQRPNEAHLKRVFGE
ncbi:MAG: sodium:pantothenate symporter [Pseudomonadota bacterium]